MGKLRALHTALAKLFRHLCIQGGLEISLGIRCLKVSYIF